MEICERFYSYSKKKHLAYFFVDWTSCRSLTQRCALYGMLFLVVCRNFYDYNL